jgi:hypothetical protein
VTSGSVVYLLCLATALACAALVLRSWSRTRVRLLLWSGICFLGMALNNLMLFLDLVVFPDVDLSLWRSLPALLGTGALLFGMIWDGE